MYVSLNFDSISIILDQVSYKFDFTLAHILPWFGPILPHEFEQIRQRNFTQARGAICNHSWKQREQQKYVYSRKQAITSSSPVSLQREEGTQAKGALLCFPLA